jgi:hypothetical protein
MYGLADEDYLYLELANMVQISRAPPGILLGLPRSFQLRSRQSCSRSPGKALSYPRRAGALPHNHCHRTVGVSPLFWTPLANIYGRRPVYLVSTLIGIVATVGTGVAKTWSTLIVARVFSGIRVGAAMA